MKKDYRNIRLFRDRGNKECENCGETIHWSEVVETPDGYEKCIDCYSKELRKEGKNSDYDAMCEYMLIRGI